MVKKNELWVDEFYDISKVLEMGAKKYGPRDWETSGTHLTHKANHDSMFHHLAESYSGITEDHESELHPLLHLACRALMGYTLWKRGQDVKNKTTE